MRQIVLDTETTGLKPEEGHRIIEIGCVELVNRELTGNNYHQYFNPEREIDAGAFAVHGISLESLADKPLLTAELPQFLAYIEGAEIIIHNAPFDVGFLNAEFRLSPQKLKPIKKYCKITDTLVMARKLHPGQRNNLDALCKRYQVDHSHRDLHGALLDAELLARVYLAMTAGQTSFFAGEENAPNQAQMGVTATHKSVSTDPLAYVEPTPAETKAHKAYLKKLREESGACVWEEEL